MIYAKAKEYGINPNAAYQLIVDGNFNQKLIQDDINIGKYKEWYEFINKFSDTFSNDFEEQLLKSLIEIGLDSGEITIRMKKQDLIDYVKDKDNQPQIHVEFAGLSTKDCRLLITKEQFGMLINVLNSRNSKND